MAYFSPFDNVYTLVAIAHAVTNENRKTFGLAQIPARTRGASLVPHRQKGRRPHVQRGPGARARARARARALSTNQNLGNSIFL